MSKTPTYQIVIPPEFKSALQAVADARGMTLARFFLQSAADAAGQPELMDLLRASGRPQKRVATATKQATPRGKRVTRK
jgi:hypothetical protein